MDNARIYFSYSRTDLEVAIKLANDLRSAGANLWLDQLDLPNGASWDIAVDKALKGSNTVLFIASQSSVASIDVLDNVLYAMEEGKSVLTVKMDNCTLPLRIKELQLIDLSNNYDAGLSHLIKELGLKRDSGSAKSPEDAFTQDPLNINFNTNAAKPNKGFFQGEKVQRNKTEEIAAEQRRYTEMRELKTRKLEEIAQERKKLEEATKRRKEEEYLEQQRKKAEEAAAKQIRPSLNEENIMYENWKKKISDTSKLENENSGASSLSFFSYARKDTEIALRLAGEIRKSGCNIWVDQMDIRPGQRWDRAIETALELCDKLIVVLSTNSLASENVLDEITYALEEQKKLIPVKVTECKIPVKLRRIQYIDLTTNYEEGVKKLIAELKE